MTEKALPVILERPFEGVMIPKVEDLPATQAASGTSKAFVGGFGDPQPLTVDRSLTSVLPLTEIVIQG